ncbi:MAG TPA: MFS transporter [Ktedonobacteraceae bacterium]|nr:MFS transporter [Ktedonobacteraceae bacterium]
MNTLNASERQNYPRRWWAFVALSFSLLVIGLDNTVLNVALPTIARDLSATQSQLQWIVDAYTLVFAGLLLTMGSLGDRFGRKKALLVGLTIFGAGSIWAAFSGSANVLIVARAFMGIGGALIMPTTLSITTNIFEGKERGRAIGAWAGVAGLSIIIGPVFGGWLLDNYSWGVIFLINVPIIAFVLLGTALLVPESKDPAASKLDPIGALLSIVGLTALLWGIIEVPVVGWSDIRIIAAFIAAAVLLLTFVVWELRSPTPMLNMKLFRNPRFSAASLALTLTAFSMFGVLFILTQYLQLILGYSPLQAGSALIALIPTLLIGSILSPRIVERIGTKIPVTIGLIIVAGAFVLLSTASVSSGYGLIASMLAILGLGFGMTMAPATTSIMGALPLGRAGVGSAVNDTTRQVGGALGVAVLGSILASVYQSSLNSASIMQLLSPPIREIIRDSIGKAAFVASHLGEQAGQMLTSAVNIAFIDAMHATALISAGVTLCGALVALLFLPAYAKDEQIPQGNLTQDGVATTMEVQEEEQLKA